MPRQSTRIKESESAGIAELDEDLAKNLTQEVPVWSVVEVDELGLLVLLQAAVFARPICTAVLNELLEPRASAKVLKTD